MTIDVNIGFIPLVDAAIPVMAVEMGFAEEEGLNILLHKETSWANIRDRLTIGHFDAAHLLAPMPVASALTEGAMYPDLIVPTALGLGGNAVTVSKAIWQQMEAFGAVDGGDATVNGRALRDMCAAWRGEQKPLLKIGVVHRFSSHNLELRYWLAASGINPETDVSFVVVPPSFMVDTLQAGRIDGYCVGEPWNALAVERGAGVIATTKSQIWRGSPEKVLGVRRAWADENVEALQKLVRAIARASQWCGDPQNKQQIAATLSQPNYLAQPETLLLRGLSGFMPFAENGTIHEVYDFLLLADQAATFPWVSHALWFYSQLVRWGYVEHSPSAVAKARATYRPDIYRQSLLGTALPIPNASLKVEGALLESTHVPTTQGTLALGPDGFFDGREFDPDLLDVYIACDKVTK